jgi:acetaldehyde dehydrogenase (acetylating)
MRKESNRALQQVEEVTPKPGKKQAVQQGALDIAKSTWRKSLLKERKVELGVMKDVLPEPPTGASAARKMQNPEHVDIVKGLMNVPSARDMGLNVKGEGIHDKMVIAATRQLSSSTGSQYSRYTAHCTLYK